ncbi:hypothetical protein P7C73_g4339, partial [Tremellales sp. Uapishka_1]
MIYRNTLSIYLVVAIFFPLVLGEYVAHPAGELVCRPFGECEPCPEDELRRPFCMPFGNRRLLHCIPASAKDNPDADPPGEVPAWEACGKVVKREKHDYWEFVVGSNSVLDEEWMGSGSGQGNCSGSGQRNGIGSGGGGGFWKWRNGAVGNEKSSQAGGGVVGNDKKAIVRTIPGRPSSPLLQTANLLFLLVALTVLWARSSALANAQYRQLAARIGIPGGSWRA